MSGRKCTVKIPLKYVNSFISRTRKTSRIRYYFRRPGMKAVPLPGIPGSDEFMAVYRAALASSAEPIGTDTSRTTPGTIAELVANYFKSAAWLDLAKDTQNNRKYLIERFRDKHANMRVALLKPFYFEKMLSEMTVGPGMKAGSKRYGVCSRAAFRT
jgi:hypothetical protein